jgi:hypothetical protein
MEEFHNSETNFMSQSTLLMEEEEGNVEIVKNENG